MSKLRSGVILEDDEKLVAEIEAELWAASSNPIARFIGAIIKVIYLILGMKKEGYIVLTDKRVIEVVSQKACWVFNTGKEVKYVLPSSVKEVGYTKEGTFLGCFCQCYSLYYDSHTQLTNVQLKGYNEQETIKLVNTFYETIVRAQK